MKHQRGYIVLLFLCFPASKSNLQEKRHGQNDLLGEAFPGISDPHLAPIDFPL